MSHCKSKQSWGLESYDLEIRLMKNQGCLLDNRAKYWKEKNSEERDILTFLNLF